MFLLWLPSPVAKAVERPPKWLSITENRGGVNLRWFRVQGAVKYQIHRRNGEDGIFEHVGETVNPIYDDLNVSLGNIYFYTIIAINRDGLLSEKADVRYIRLAPVETEATLSPEWEHHQIRRDGIALAWLHENPDHVFAYNLYKRKESDSTFSLLSSTLATTYLDRDVFEGNTYE